ncbi:hypothetical protein [Neptuniibacter sp.]|uniref:hypothetical protein n=1 Tax=Neptuniibacter sp. TaxID=1962643 RepID=UPI00261937A0|nr:hypothetical protein [Neptuniibacter sp.]MCP4597824.1 hypothetical protein [Neptuniibacter sp.]
MVDQGVFTEIQGMTYFELKSLLNSKGKELRYVRRRSAQEVKRPTHIGATSYQAVAGLEV